MNGLWGWGLAPPPTFPARRRCGGAALLLLEEWLAATARQSPVVRRRYSPSSEPWLKKSRADNACGTGPRGRAMTPIRGRVEGKAAARQGGRAPGAHTGARFQDWCRASCAIKITPIRIQTLHNSAGCRYLKTSAAVTRRTGGSFLPRCFLLFICTSKFIYINDPHRKRPTESNDISKTKKEKSVLRTSLGCSFFAAKCSKYN